MVDKLNLLDLSEPLQDRYDRFLVWINSVNYTVSEFIADELGIDVSAVDVFFELGNLSDDEFNLIDNCGFDIGLLFILVRIDRPVRLVIYGRAQEILSSKQPLTLLKQIADENGNLAQINALLQMISPDCLVGLATYLKQRGVNQGTINTSIRNMLINASKAKYKGDLISDSMINWMHRAIAYDKEHELNIFSNAVIAKNHPADYKIFQEISNTLL